MHCEIKKKKEVGKILPALFYIYHFRKNYL